MEMEVNDRDQVMVTRGFNKRACAVVLVDKVKNPIKLAREMLVRGGKDGSVDGDLSGDAGGAQGHCCLGGATVEKLAKNWGLEMVDETYFWTRKRWDEHKRGLRESQDERWDGEAYLPQGTVGCIALDQYGTMCVATSTGGYVFSEFIFPLLNHVLNPETCLGGIYSLDVFQGSLYILGQARLTPKS